MRLLSEMKFFLGTFLLLFLFALFFFNITTAYRMPVSYNYDSDFGRDLLMMHRITQGKHILIGPQLSFAGLHLGPYPFYLFAPFLRIGNDAYQWVVAANAFLFLSGFILLFFFWNRELGIEYSALSLLWLVTTPYIILAARSAGNAFSYLIFLVWYLVILYSVQKFSSIIIILLGVLGGIIVHFHPISFFVTSFSFLGKITTVKNIHLKEKVIASFLFCLSFLSTFLPVILFEVRHNFVITKTAFDIHRYGEFFEKRNFSLFSFNQSSQEWLPVGILGLIFFMCILLRNKKTKDIYIWFSISLLILLSLFLLGKWAPHYFFPSLLLMQLVTIFFVAKTRYRLFFLAILVAINIFFFPGKFYKKARNLRDVEKTFSHMLNEGNIPKENMNVLLINDTYLSIVGYEYRFLLEKNGYSVDDEFSYRNSRYILLISEKGEIDWEKKTSWELSEFGNKQLKEKYVIDNTVFYLFEKS